MLGNDPLYAHCRWWWLEWKRCYWQTLYIGKYAWLKKLHCCTFTQNTLSMKHVTHWENKETCWNLILDSNFYHRFWNLTLWSEKCQDMMQDLLYQHKMKMLTLESTTNHLKFSLWILWKSFIVSTTLKTRPQVMNKCFTW